MASYSTVIPLCQRQSDNSEQSMPVDSIASGLTAPLSASVRERRQLHEVKSAWRATPSTALSRDGRRDCGKFNDHVEAGAAKEG